MNPLNEYHRLSEGLFIWYGYDPGCKCDCSSCAVKTPSGMVLIDPLPLEDAVLEEILGQQNPAAILLTSANHQRASHELRKCLGIPIFASQEAKGEVGADQALGESLNTLRIIPLPGAGPGEIAICADETLIVGDALIRLDDLEFLPDKYCSDPKLLRKSARDLLKLDFQRVCFAHGLPLVTQAREKLSALIGQ